MASCRECPCDSASCRDSRQEAKSHGQSLQKAIYQAQQSRQEARDRGQSRRKPHMTAEATLERLRKIFRKKKKQRKTAPEPQYDRDNVDFLPPIMIEESVKRTISDPGVKEINADELVLRGRDSILTMKKVSSLGLV